VGYICYRHIVKLGITRNAWTFQTLREITNSLSCFMKWLKSLGISRNDWNFDVQITLSAWTGLDNKWNDLESTVINSPSLQTAGLQAPADKQSRLSRKINSPPVSASDWLPSSAIPVEIIERLESEDDLLRALSVPLNSADDTPPQPDDQLPASQPDKTPPPQADDQLPASQPDDTPPPSLMISFQPLSLMRHHHPSLMISFQPLSLMIHHHPCLTICRQRSVPRHLDCAAATFWRKGRGQESVWQIKQIEWSRDHASSCKLAT